MVSKSALGIIDRGLGFLFGLARGVLLIIVALFAYDQFIATGDGVKIIEDSQTKLMLSESQDRLAAEVEDSTIPAWFIARFDELTSVCTADSDTGAAIDTNALTPATNN